MIFWQVKSCENLTWKSYSLSTSTVIRSHFTLGNPKMSFSTVLFIHTADYLHYLRRKQSVKQKKIKRQTFWGTQCILLYNWQLKSFQVKTEMEMFLWSEIWLCLCVTVYNAKGLKPKKKGNYFITCQLYIICCYFYTLFFHLFYMSMWHR